MKFKLGLLIIIGFFISNLGFSNNTSIAFIEKMYLGRLKGNDLNKLSSQIPKSINYSNFVTKKENVINLVKNSISKVNGGNLLPSNANDLLTENGAKEFADKLKSKIINYINYIDKLKNENKKDVKMANQENQFGSEIDSYAISLTKENLLENSFKDKNLKSLIENSPIKTVIFFDGVNNDLEKILYGNETLAVSAEYANCFL